jgi:hypothetical protein
MRKNRIVEFDCPRCAEPLELDKDQANKPCNCPSCNQMIQLDLGSQTDLVPVRINVPKLGTFEGRMSKEDAGRMGQTWLGGMLALLGVIVCVMLGIGPPKRS